MKPVTPPTDEQTHEWVAAYVEASGGTMLDWRPCYRAGLPLGHTLAAIQRVKKMLYENPTAEMGFALVGRVVEPNDSPKEVCRWIDHKKGGLLVASLAADIRDGYPMMHDRGSGVWIYQDGVWVPDQQRWILSALTDRMGERFRASQTVHVTDYLIGQTEILEVGPTSQYINLKNGLLDWRKGVLLPHDSAVPSTVQLNTRWNPEAICPEIDKWLADVLDPELLEPTDDGPGFIWEVIGYLCFSGNPHHKAFLFMGTGRNGKGTLQRVITVLLGRQNISNVDLHSLVSSPFASAQLLGKIANIAGDLDSTYLTSTAIFKSITGGDSVTAQHKYGQPFDFTPFCTMVYSANATFGTADTSDGYMSRWVPIPFPHTFTGREDRSYDARLSQPSEIEGMLVKAMAGLKTVMARGNFSSPTPVAEAMDRFTKDSDPIRRFISDVSEPAAGGWVVRSRLWTIYQAWTVDNGVKSLGRNRFYERILAAGWSENKTMGTVGFTGRTMTAEIEGRDPFTGAERLHLRSDDQGSSR